MNRKYSVSQYDDNSIIKNRNLTNFILLALALLGSQRFLLPNISSLICIIPFALSLFYIRSNKKLSLTYLIISLFLSVDNGVGAYYETNFILRYSIYILVLYYLFSGYKIRENSIIIILSFIIFLLFLTFFNVDLIDNDTFKRDIFLLFLFTIIFTRSSRTLNDIDVNLTYLRNFFLFFLGFELINILLFYDVGYDYLSYDSTKSLIVLPLIYLVIYGRTMATTVVFILTLWVMIAYTTRMIFVSLFLALFIYSIKIIIKKQYFILYLFFIAIIIFLFGSIDLSSLNLEGHKATNMLYLLLNNSSPIELLQGLDKGRFFENKLFFDQNIFNILFGNGLGSGIFDKSGLLNFIGYNDTAFSAKELDSKYFYSFHDVWIDIGLRFGLVFVLGILMYLILNIMDKQQNITFYAFLLIILMLCQFFSTAGLLMISIFSLLLRAEVYRNRKGATYVK